MKYWFIFICFAWSSVFAQKQNDIWNFGRGCSMYFTSGEFGSLIKTTGEDSVPPHAFNDYIYHIATMCDKNTGSLLFYSNGDKVLDRTNQQMPNGKLSSGYATHIVATPDASDSTQYFVFYSTNLPGIRYAKVDMKLNNGMGDVVVKDVLISNDLGPEFVVIKQYYNEGHWLVGHSLSSDSFYVFRIFGSKIYPPLVSYGPPIDGPITITVDGSRIAFAYNVIKETVAVYSFDKKCGKLQFLDSLDAGGQCYGLAFDVTSQFLYASGYTGGAYDLYQYDFLKAVPPSQTKKVIGTTRGLGSDAALYPLLSLKLAPDNKIYITTEEMVGNGLSPASFLYAIFNPSFGSSPGFLLQPAVRLNPLSKNNLCAGGPCYITNNLPDFVADRTNNDKPGTTNPDIQAENFCMGDSTLFTANKDFFADSVKWVFGNGDSSNLLNSKTLYKNAGSYTARFKWYACGFEYGDTISVFIINKSAVNLGPDVTLCSGDSITLDAGASNLSYKWSTGDTTSFITVHQSGQYSVRVMSKGCEDAVDAININYYQHVPIALEEEYFICDDNQETVILDAGNGFETYNWTPGGEITQTIEVADTGIYTVVVIDNHGCNDSAGAIVKRRCQLHVYFPDAFTPNGDDVNEIYMPIGGEVISFNMRIYNRWGEMIFETNDIHKGWNGRVKDGYATPGVYVYHCVYSGYANKQLQNFKANGQLTLIR